MFTFKSFFTSRSTIGLGTMNASNNLIGQYWSNDRKFDEKINWAQPISDLQLTILFIQISENLYFI